MQVPPKVVRESQELHTQARGNSSLYTFRVSVWGSCKIKLTKSQLSWTKDSLLFIGMPDLRTYLPF